MSGLSQSDKEAVKSGAVVLIANCPPAGGNSGTTVRSTLDALSTLQTFDERGVGFSAITQPELDTTTAAGKLMFVIWLP